MKSSYLKLLFQKRRWRIRKKTQGTQQRPRLVVTFTHSHIYAQCIDDVVGHTIVSESTLSPIYKSQKLKPNLEGASALGNAFAKKALSAGVKSVVFDRAGRAFHGCVKSFADAARSAGLAF